MFQSACALAVLFLAVMTSAVAATPVERTVVYVLFDGFSPAELDAAQPTPNFNRLKQEGAWSRHLVPAFPTISMINHTTAYTGCWPERHGVVSNVFIDPKLGRYGIEGGDVSDGKWRTGCETIWEAAERQGVRAAVFNAAGRWSSLSGPRATYINPEVPWKKREGDAQILQRALNLLQSNTPQHPRLIVLYFPFPDEVAHTYGVAAPETAVAVRRADVVIGKLLDALKRLPKGREGTLVVGSDHGMIDVGPYINFGRILAENHIYATEATSGASSFLYVDKSRDSVDRVERALSKYRELFSVYRTGRYPAFAHLGVGPRVGDLMVLTHPPYWMAGPEVFPPGVKFLGLNWFWPRTFTPPLIHLKAMHGYDPGVKEMHAVFFAWGAGVRPGEIEKLDQVDVHPTVMRLLGLEPGRPVDGRAIDQANGPN